MATVADAASLIEARVAIVNDKNFAHFLEELNKNRVYKKTAMVSKDDLLRDGVVVYGAGNHGGIVAAALLANGVAPDWVVDKNPSVVNEALGNIPVRGVDSLKDIKKQFVVLSSSYINELIAECEKSNVLNYILPYSLSDTPSMMGDIGFSDDLTQYFDEIKQIYSILKDDLSKKVYRDFLQFHLKFDLSVFAAYEPKMYFPPDLTDIIDYSFFVDAGASVGDTLKVWLEYFKPKMGGREYSYYAFEPIPKQFDELSSYIAGFPPEVRENIFPLDMALGDRESVLNINDHGQSSTILANDLGDSSVMKKVRVTSIDFFFADRKTTMIKADVEGFEKQLLNGALAVLTRDRPSLAISAYHHFKDIFDIPLLIGSFNLDYDFYFRHHQLVYGDTVCYAIPRR